MEVNTKEEQKFYQITVFDCGNERAKYIINKWIIISKDELGNLSLLNINGKDRIASILYWKVRAIEE